MRSQGISRTLTILAGAVLLSHCAQKPVSKGEELRPRFKPQLEQQDIQMGAELHKEVLQAYAVLDNPELQAYVNEIGQRLAQQSRLSDLRWHFTVVDSPEVNAIALPGGYVYVTRGIMVYLNSEAELAAVLAHQIGHLSARHTVHQPGANPALGPDTMLGSILVPDLNNPRNPTLRQIMAQTWTAGYGRDYELQADRLGARYIAQAGYPPHALIDLIRELKNQAWLDAELAKKEGRDARRYHGTLTRLEDDERLSQVAQEAERYMSKNPRDGRNVYLQKMAGVYFGDSPERGVVRNNALLYPKPGLAIQFPAGWRPQHQADRVVAISPQNDALLEFRPGPKNARSMEALHALKLDTDARYVAGNIHGYPASFAAGEMQGKPVLVGDVVFGGTQYLIGGLCRDAYAYNQHRDTLKAAINSFHAITAVERIAARTYRIRIVTAQPGTTLARLAKQSPWGSNALAQLRVLNNLYPNGEPLPGQLLKIIQ